MRAFILIVVLSALALGCSKLPGSQISKREKAFKEHENSEVAKREWDHLKFIQDIQIVLLNIGYYNGPIDGKFSNSLRRAIKHFQKDNGMVINGKLDKKTALKLEGY